MSEENNSRSVFGIVKKSLFIALALALVAIVIWAIIRGGGDDDEVINREYNEQEVAAAAEELIKSSELLTEIYFGDGIPFISEGEFASNYRPANTEYLEKIGVKYIKDLKNLTRGTFSESESEFLFSIFLSRVDSDEFVGAVHYIPSYEGEDEEKRETGILVYKDREKSALVNSSEKTVHNYSTIKVLYSEGERVKISLESTVVCDDGRMQTQINEIYLVEEDAGWRLDSQTKCAYIGE